MPLEFQPRADGFRVVKMNGGVEYMIASICSNASELKTLPQMTDQEFDKLASEIGASKALHERQSRVSGGPTTVYTPMDLNECTIHSASGPLRVEEIQEMLDFLKNRE